MFESPTNTLPDSNSRHLQSHDAPIEVTTDRSRQFLASTSRQALRRQNRGGDRAGSAMPLPSAKRIESRATASDFALGRVQEPLARLMTGAQEELNRLHNIARQARYELVIRTPQGLAVDCHDNPNAAPEVRDPDQSIGGIWPRSGKDGAARDRVAVRGAAITPLMDDLALMDFGSHYRIRHRGLSAAAAFIFDAHGAVIGTLDVRPIGQNEPVRPDALTRAIIQATARAIEERAFREEHRREWIVAVTPLEESRPGMLFAVDREQNILAADRHGRTMQAGSAAESMTPGKGPSLWALFERNPATFYARDRGDISTVLVPRGIPETWSALVTPPESNSARLYNPDIGLHARPRLGGIANLPQLTWTPQALGGLPPGVLRRVRAFIDANLETAIELADLAAIATLSRCHFARAFKQSVGRTPHGYLMHRRLEKAQQLLASTDLPLAEIALATGFSDQSHFSRRFRDYLGTTPSAFRKSKR